MDRSSEKVVMEGRDGAVEMDRSGWIAELFGR